MQSGFILLIISHKNIPSFKETHKSSLSARDASAA
jgi:hypothetical protein